MYLSFLPCRIIFLSFLAAYVSFLARARNQSNNYNFHPRTWYQSKHQLKIISMLFILNHGQTQTKTMLPSVTHKQVEQHSTMFVHGKIPLCPSTVRSRQAPASRYLDSPLLVIFFLVSWLNHPSPSNSLLLSWLYVYMQTKDDSR
jgi:hypothetical protein